MPNFFTDLVPGVDSIINLGASGNEFRTLFIDGNINMNGSNTGIILSGVGTIGPDSSGNLTIGGASGKDVIIDSADDIILDAQGNDVYFYDAGVAIGAINHDGSSNFILRSEVQDKDMKFKGNDGGSTITALVLDMSANGTATFSHDIKLPDSGVINFDSGQVNLYHTSGADNFVVDAVGDIILDADGGDITLKDDGTTFGALVNSSGNLSFKSGTTTMLTCSGANAEFKGNVTVNAGVLSISSDGGNHATITEGGNGELEIATAGTFEVNSAVGIKLDASTGNTILLDDSTEYGRLSNFSTHLSISTEGNEDKDIVFRGDDGGTPITALTLDMSEAGKAQFNGDVELKTTKRLYFDAGMLSGGGDTYIYHHADNDLRTRVGGTEVQKMTENTASFTQNMTLAGDLTVNGGDITIGGTGRITGIDTVSGSTDAASKSYVDGVTWMPTLNQNTTGSAASLSGLSYGDIVYGGESAYAKLSGNAASSNKFLRSRGAANTASAPSWESVGYQDVAGLGNAVTLNTGTVSNGALTLATGDAIHTFVTTQTDAMAANTTGSSGSCTGNAATATALTSGNKTISGDLAVDNITSTANGGDPSIYINSTRPTLGFTDTNSFTDPDDIYLIRGGANILQFQYYDDSAGSTTETFNITSAGNATFAGSLATGSFVLPNSIGSSGQVLQVPSSGTTLEWATASGGSSYTLPTAANGTLGGVQIGYVENNKNYPVELSSEKMFVNVPWTDNNTTYTAGGGIAESGNEFSVSAGYGLSQNTTGLYLDINGQTEQIEAGGSNQTHSFRDTAFIVDDPNVTSGDPTKKVFLYDLLYSLTVGAQSYAGGLQLNGGSSPAGATNSIYLGIDLNTTLLELSSSGLSVNSDAFYAADFIIGRAVGNMKIDFTQTAYTSIKNNNSEEFRLTNAGILHCNGDIVGNSTTISSDIKLKKNIRSLDQYGLNEVLKLKPVMYDWKNEEKGSDNIGFIAQDVQEVIPELVNESVMLNGEEGETKLGVEYSKMVAVLTKAIQEQQKQIDELKQIINGGSK